MKPLYVVLLTVALAVGGYFAFFYSSCEQPDELTVQLTALSCAQALITPQLRVEACKSLGREDECQFTEEDRDAINTFVFGKILSCVEQKLKSDGMCVDKVEGYLR